MWPDAAPPNLCVQAHTQRDFIPVAESQQVLEAAEMLLAAAEKGLS